MNQPLPPALLSTRIRFPSASPRRKSGKSATSNLSLCNAAPCSVDKPVASHHATAVATTESRSACVSRDADGTGTVETVEVRFVAGAVTGLVVGTDAVVVTVLVGFKSAFSTPPGAKSSGGRVQAPGWPEA